MSKKKLKNFILFILFNKLLNKIVIIMLQRKSFVILLGVN
jgi:hypothetical protein